MRTIDIHAHLMPPQFWQTVAQGQPWYGVRYEQDADRGWTVSPAGRNPVLTPKLRFTPEERLRDMDEQKVDVQVISVATPLFGYYLDAAQGRQLARAVNDEIAAMTRQWPTRFAGLATLPMQEVGTAIDALERAVHMLSLKGAELDTVVNSLNWDEPVFLVWSKNPNTALWQELRTGPLPISDLHMGYLIPHTQRQLRVEQVEDARRMDWKTLLAYITGTVDQELLLRNEYLVTENRILRHQITGRVPLTDGERKTLAHIGYKLGKQALEEVANIVKPDTILAWHRKLVAKKFDGSQQRKAAGRPPIDGELEALVVRLARENRSWGYDRIVGSLAHLGYTLSDQTVGNILKRHGILRAPERKKTTTWQEFIRMHMDVLVATDFFTAEVWTTAGLVTYYVLFFFHLASRKVHVAGVTPHPDQAWMMQMARQVTMADWGFLSPGQYLIHDRDGKYCPAFQQIIDDAGVQRVPLPPRSPNLNAYAERWVRSVKEEALSHLILFGERSLRHALSAFDAHYHTERPHQGKGNVILLPVPSQGGERHSPIQRRERLGGLLKYYTREAA